MGSTPPASTVVFEIVVDDYAEVWVDGKLPVALGQTGGPFVKGFNAPNRVVIAREARAGAAHPARRVRRQRAAVESAAATSSGSARRRSISTSAAARPHGETKAAGDGASIRRSTPSCPPGPTIEKLAEGFLFTEGPVWVPDGYLLFSDPNANTIYRWTPDGQVSVFRTKSGYAGVDIARVRPAGLERPDARREGRVTINEHGNRRVMRIERTGAVTVLADRYEGKRLNSPNDLVYRSDGALYFTDPPFGLPKAFDDQRKELPFSGVFSLKDGELQLVTRT